jgi:hypothetical protein
MQFIDLVNNMVQRKYENQYPRWIEEIKDVTTQLIKIDPRWELKTVLLMCGHTVLRNYDCTCDQPFFLLKTGKTDKLRAKTMNIYDLIDKRNSLTRKLVNTIFERVVEESYPQYKMLWVGEIRKVIRQILDIDPSWELECIKEQLKCLKIRLKPCKCSQVE